MKQRIKENETFWLYGHKMVAKNVREVKIKNETAVRFNGFCTEHQSCDDIRDTEYNGGTYGGNSLKYTWEI